MFIKLIARIWQLLFVLRLVKSRVNILATWLISDLCGIVDLTNLLTDLV